MSDASPPVPASPPDLQIAYMVPWEKFIYRDVNGWAFDSPVGKDGIANHLAELGWEASTIEGTIKNRTYVRVYGYDREPNKPGLYYASSGKLHINVWEAPALAGAPGTYPRIDALLDFLTNHDPDGARWLKNWIARKLQDPALVPKVCVVITTEPGGGKNTLYAIIAHLLGPANCEILKREQLESRFNSSWAQKLFVMGDEILSDETVRDVSNSLKMYIDATELGVEAKFQNQRRIKNRLAWIFASNNPVSPVVIEKHDRRYTVFSNHDEVTPDYRALLRSCFTADGAGPTKEFFAEIAALKHDLETLTVDVDFVSKPYENEARRNLIDASMPSHHLFLQHVQDHGIDEILTHVLENCDFSLVRTRDEWEFEGGAIATRVLYRCYQEFCKQAGNRPLKLNKFGAALKAHRPAWGRIRQTQGKRTWGYYVPRVART